MLLDCVSVSTIILHVAGYCVFAWLHAFRPLDPITVELTAYNFTGVRETTAPVYKKAGDLDPTAVIMVFFLLSALFQAVGYGLSKERRFDEAVELRYFEYSVSASLMFMLMGGIIGMVRLETMALLFVAMFATNMLGLAAHTAESKLTRWVFHLAGWVTFAVPFILMVHSLAETDAASAEKLDPKLWGVVAGAGGLMAAFGAVQVYDLAWRPDHKRDLEAHFARVGAAYDVLSFADKATLAGLIYGTLANMQ